MIFLFSFNENQKAMNRQQFIKSVGVSSLIILIVPLFSFTKPQEKPQLDKDLVQKFVGAPHADFDTVKALMKNTLSC